MGPVTRERLEVEWQHVRGARGTCGRCTDTGQALEELRDDISRRVGPDREVSLTETILPDEALDDSNRVLVNGVPVEELLDAELESTDCTGCTELSACCGSGEPAQCRAIVVEGEVHESLGADLLARAVDLAIGDGG